MTGTTWLTAMGGNGVDSANVRAAYANAFKSGDKADIASLRISAITGFGGRRVFADFRGVA